MDCSPPGSSLHGILQARILEWVAMPSFRGSSWLRIKLASLMSLTSPVLAGELFTIPATWETNHLLLNIVKSLKFGNNFSFLCFWSLFSAKITINRLKNFTSISQSTQGTENPGLWISIVWAWEPLLFSSSIVSSLLCLSQKEWASDSISLELPIDLVSDSAEVCVTVWGMLEILDQKGKKRPEAIKVWSEMWFVDLFICFFVFLRCNGHITLYEFQVCNIMIHCLYTYCEMITTERLVNIDHNT